jgi:hypothetical protein
MGPGDPMRMAAAMIKCEQQQQGRSQQNEGDVQQALEDSITKEPLRAEQGSMGGTIWRL